MFWEQRVGLDHPYLSPFSQEKGERKRNVGSRTGLSALEPLGNWLCRNFSGLFLKRVGCTKMAAPVCREMSFSMKHNRWQINSAKEKHLEEALSWNYGPMRPALELDISHYTVGFNRRWERITIKLLLWTLAISWHSIREEL